MKVKGKTIKYIFEALKEKGVDFSEIFEKLPEEYKNLLSTGIESIKDNELFPFHLYMEILKEVCHNRNKEFAKIIGKKIAEIFLLKELRIAKRIKDTQWLISKDFLIGDNFYGGIRYVTEKISENKIKVKFENMNEINEFVEEKIKGFLEGIFEAAEIKTEVSTISSPLKGDPFLELVIKW